MANRTPTTPPRATEVLSQGHPFTHTPISKAVAQLPAAIARFVDAERDLGDIDNMFDPAVSSWLSDADESQESLTKLLSEICAAPVWRDSDFPLQRLAFLVQDLLDGHTPQGLAGPEGLAALRRQFSCPDSLPHAARINSLVAAVLNHLRDLAAYEAFDACEAPGTCDVFDSDALLGTCEVFDSHGLPGANEAPDAYDLFAARGRTTARDWLARRNRSDAARHRDGYDSYSLALFDDGADDLRDLLPRRGALSA